MAAKTKSDLEVQIEYLQDQIYEMEQIQYWTINWIHSFFDAQPRLIDPSCQDQCMASIRAAEKEPYDARKQAYGAISEVLMLSRGISCRKGFH